MVLNHLDDFLVATFPSVSPLWVGGVLWAGLAFVLMLLFEWTNAAQVQHVRSTVKGRELHNAAMYANMINHLVLGPITYYLTIGYCCQPLGSLTLFQQVVRCTGLLLVEGVMYYWIHRAFHELPGFYWMHKFHHQFHGDVVLPSSASAVSVWEFVLAYMLPFPVGALLSGSDKWSALSAATIVVISNLYIHTPALKDTLSCLPWMLVSPSDHLQHHRQIRSNYAAPFFHCDRMLDYLTNGGGQTNKVSTFVDSPQVEDK